jgi:hypothetical protein
METLRHLEASCCVLYKIAKLIATELMGFLNVGVVCHRASRSKAGSLNICSPQSDIEPTQ